MICKKKSRKLCGNKDCKICFKKSFATHSRAIEWSDANDCNPINVFPGTKEKYIFDCSCGHVFDTMIYNITSKNSQCPYCTSKKLCDDDDCEQCYNNSFAFHPKAKYWSDANEHKPRNVFKGSDKQYIFDCKCGHVFTNHPKKITNVDRWCAYCANKKLCDDQDCNDCYQKSFESDNRSKYWSKHNKISSRMVFKKSNTKFKFRCENGHPFEGSPNNIVSTNMWCAKCKHKTQAKLLKWLKTSGYEITFQAKYDWCKNINYLPFDFAIEELKLIIELDGRQHLEQVSNWVDPKIIQQTDLLKMKKSDAQWLYCN